MKPLKNAILKEKLIASCKIAAVIMLFSSCAVRSVYIPVSVNSPLFDDKKAIQATVYAGANHLEVQAAHNPFKKVAFCGNINFGSGISIYDFAVGTYGYNSTGHWRYETFIGYGYNSNYAFQTANYNSLIKQPVKNYEVRSFYDKYYLQPSIGYFGDVKMYKLKYSFQLAARVSALYFKTYSFKEYDYDLAQQNGAPVYTTDVNYKNSFLYLAEPCFINKVGIGNVYAILQAQIIIPYSEQINIRNTVFSPVFIFGAGIQYQFTFKPKKIVPKD